MKHTRSIILISVAALSAGSLHVMAAQNIENELYSVGVEASEGSFTVVSKQTGKLFLNAGKLCGTGGTGKAIELIDKVWSPEFAGGMGDHYTRRIYQPEDPAYR